jgi:predicted nucleic acid-binding Zn ribbon protein
MAPDKVRLQTWRGVVTLGTRDSDVYVYVSRDCGACVVLVGDINHDMRRTSHKVVLGRLRRHLSSFIYGFIELRYK